MSVQLDSSQGVPKLLTVADVMAALQIGRTSVYSLFNSGQLRWVQVGSHRRVTADEIARFVVEHTAGAARVDEAELRELCMDRAEKRLSEMVLQGVTGDAARGGAR